MKSLKILELDPWLKPYAKALNLRLQNYQDLRKSILGKSDDLANFANGHLFYGISSYQDGWIYREWAPGADELHLIGDFNGWDRWSHPMHRRAEGFWEIQLKGKNALKHGQKIKVEVGRRGRKFDRIPLYIHRAVQDDATKLFAGQIWAPEKRFRWTDGAFRKKKLKAPLIYEAHIGMAQEKEGIGSYREFADSVLPRIVEDGYTAIQLMAIQEHAYYASFGYQVTNFFACSSWYGEPEDLKYLINKAHRLGLAVFLDVVHSHASSNTTEGINMFDGTMTQFFHAGGQGNHPAWGTKLFDYGKPEVLHFLLSNLKYWLEEYHFDGFRFDGVTSMIYKHHGLGVNFDNYKKYFDESVDTDAIVYLQLANELIHSIKPNAITIAEEMSGMPGMCLPIKAGGIGFDYRLAMGVPDYWVRTLKHENDEKRNLHEMWHELTTRRPSEKNIGYCESHDQALVGDKTLIFRMADAEMYDGMDKIYHSPNIDRAIDLHKIIRLVTLSLAGEAYLNFMGNEFGHPEWIDFPREGNGWSYKYARRQWSLADNGYLKYEWLGNFDKAMLKLAKRYRLLEKAGAQKLWLDSRAKILAYERGGLLFVANFHPTRSAKSFFLPTGQAGKYQAFFSSDAELFGGQNRINLDYIYKTKRDKKRGQGFEIYLPCRTMAVFKMR